jgi:hypothetical protein
MEETKHPGNEDRAAATPEPDRKDRGKKKRKFEPPEVISYSGDDILDELGPAHACNPFSGAVVAC